MGRLLVLLSVVALGYLLWKWLEKQPRKKQLQVGAIIVAGVFLVAAATGRLHWLFALFAGLLPFVQRIASVLFRFLPLIQRIAAQTGAWKREQGPSSGQQSAVETRFLRMLLDHDTGEMDGEVLEGRNRGDKLSSLSLSALTALLQECRSEDPESAQLLEAYLHRMHGDDWQDSAAGKKSGGSPANSSNLGREEACAILGLSPDADREQIISAHRKLMQKIHPDRGGSDYLAAKINQAKSVLLD